MEKKKEETAARKRQTIEKKNTVEHERFRQIRRKNKNKRENVTVMLVFPVKRLIQ